MDRPSPQALTLALAEGRARSLAEGRIPPDREFHPAASRKLDRLLAATIGALGIATAVFLSVPLFFA